MYQLSADDYEELLSNNITQKYKVAKPKVLEDIDRGFDTITRKLNISERVDKSTEKPAFVTLKDHKNNFNNNPKARLINPNKSALGRVSKQMLDRINTEIKASQPVFSREFLEPIDHFVSASPLIRFCFNRMRN